MLKKSSKHSTEFNSSSWYLKTKVSTNVSMIISITKWFQRRSLFLNFVQSNHSLSFRRTAYTKYQFWISPNYWEQKNRNLLNVFIIADHGALGCSVNLSSFLKAKKGTLGRIVLSGRFSNSFDPFWLNSRIKKLSFI